MKSGWLARWWCSVVGHARPLRGWWGDALYGRVSVYKEDGLGRIHATVELTCPVCDEEYTGARFCVNDAEILKSLRKHGVMS